MKDFYINSIIKRKQNHIKEYLQTLTNVFGEVISLEVLREQPEEKQIEVMKGASSVLYGSGAASAVISITTKQEVQKKFGLTTNTVVGTDRPTEDATYGLQAITNSVNLGGTLNTFFYQAQVNHQFSDGMSAVAAPEGEALFIEDTFNRFNARVNLGLKLNDHLKFSRFIAIDDVDAEFDDFSFLDAENKSITNQWRTGGNLTWSFNKGKLVINDQYSEMDREIESSFPSKFESKVYSFDTFLQYQILSEMNLVVGINGNLSEMNSFSIPFGSTDFNQDINQETANFNYFDPYLNVVYNSSFGFNLSAGARANVHSLYGSQFVYQVNPSYNIALGSGNLKVLGSYSTAYITPSLFQIYDPAFGNEDLLPEENATLEGGFEYTKGTKLRVSAVYFSRNEDNFVDFVTVDPDNFVFQYQNIADSFEASGVEVEAEAKIYKGLSANANFTYTQADERFALRIPETKGLLGLNYAFDCGANIFSSFQYVSDRDDSFFNPDTFESETIVLDSYNLVNLNANYPVSEKVKLFVALDNLLDTEFEELYRFQARGRNIRLGVQLKL